MSPLSKSTRECYCIQYAPTANQPAKQLVVIERK